MNQFNSDFAIFGILTASLQHNTALGEAIIDYTNNSCTTLYGKLKGRTIASLLTEICDDPELVERLLQTLEHEKEFTVEGKLNSKFIKYHTRLVHYCDTKANCPARFIQSGITNISESVILKQFLYGTSEALKRAAKAADDDTGQHIVRINEYSALLATLAHCPAHFVEEISQFAQLHDIGKINVTDIIKLPRKLTDEEFAKIQQHTIHGGEIIANLAGLEMAHTIALEHHERWDGTGYPYRKKEKEISLAARIVAIADVFDALVSKRPYKEPFSYEKTKNIFAAGDGRVMPGHFDPELLGLFLKHYDAFIALHQKLKD